jgi:hypothetical protein
MRIGQLIAIPLMYLISTFAYGPPAAPLPEPETLALVGIGAVALFIARWRKKK